MAGQPQLHQKAHERAVLLMRYTQDLSLHAARVLGRVREDQRDRVRRRATSVALQST